MLVGLSVNHKEGLSCISNAYVNAVIKAGGIPILIPLNTSKYQLDQILSRLDGLILSGGGDINASFFGEELHPSVTDFDTERDIYDIHLVQLAKEKQIPILGICRGMQVMNVALGGNLIQDIPSIVPSNIIHSQQEPREIGTHTVSIKEDSQLFSIISKKELLVNSFHHQAIGNIAPGFIATAFAPDRIIEAFESEEGYFMMGVQWHPENMAVAENPDMKAIFQHFVSEADLYSRAKEIHQRIITLDSHTDTPMYFRYGIDIGKDNGIIKVNPKDLGDSEDCIVDYQIKVDVPKMKKGMLDATIMVAYIPQGSLSDKEQKKATDYTFSTLNTLRSQISNCKQVEQAYTGDDLKRIKKENKKAILLGLENGYGIGKDLDNLKRLADIGVVYITLSHNGDNNICDSHKGNRTHNGLSEYGKQVVREMNRLGIIIDISHTSEKTSFDVLETSKYPIIASHSSAKTIANHSRNLSDDLIKAIADKGGVIQIGLYKYFIEKDGRANVSKAIDHIDHIVRLVGIDHVGIGSDFDGGGGFSGLQDVTEVIQITLELLRRGYTETEITKIWGGNFIRVMNIVQSVRINKNK
ncbi:membrane dipeptidase [Bacteroidales bacterium OttesenSCG-928-M11]|nr:membrane dipeptidase [Bacteroidales bacterium OttesenSCG-928-M11]